MRMANAYSQLQGLERDSVQMPFGGIPAYSALLLGKPGAFVLDSSAPEQSLCTAGNQQMGWRDWGRGLAVGSRDKGSRG